MSTAKIAITIEEEMLGKLDRLVSSKVFPNRSKAIQEAIKEKLTRVNRSRLARECAKLDPAVEKAIAEEGFSQEIDQWPEYCGAKSTGQILTQQKGTNNLAFGLYSF